MKTRQLGTSDLHPSVVSFGTWGIGGPPFWTTVREEDAVAALRRAFDLGITCFDTAPVYGLGHAERILARALKDVRREVIYATKVGLSWRGDRTSDIYRDLSPAAIHREVNESLTRLETDVIDLYQVHWPDAKIPIAESFAALATLQREGKIRHIGVCNYTVEMMDEARRYADIVSLQPRYNLLDRRIETTHQPYCIRHGMGLLPYSPLASGLLTGKYGRESRFEQDWRSTIGDMYRSGVYERNIDVVDALRPIAADAGCTMTELAIAWVLAADGVTSALVGANSPIQIEQSARAADIILPSEILDRIAAVIPAPPEE